MMAQRDLFLISIVKVSLGQEECRDEVAMMDTADGMKCLTPSP